MSMVAKVSGACLCGAVKYSSEADLDHAHACHCKMCQKAGGVCPSAKCTAPLVFENEDTLGVYKSSDWGERLFCSVCGSSLAWRMQDGSLVFVAVGTLDDASEVKFESQIFIDHKPDYYNFAEETHNMTEAEVLAAFAEQTNG